MSIQDSRYTEGSQALSKQSLVSPVLHKVSAQNRVAASVAASKALYSFFLILT